MKIFMKEIDKYQILMCLPIFHYRYICWTLGMDEAGAAKKQSHDQSHDQSYYHLEGVMLLPYILHLVVLTVFGWFFIHIQVIQGLKVGPIPYRKYGEQIPTNKKSMSHPFCLLWSLNNQQGLKVKDGDKIFYGLAMTMAGALSVTPVRPYVIYICMYVRLSQRPPLSKSNTFDQNFMKLGHIFLVP